MSPAVRPLAAFVRLTRPLFLYGGFAGVALGAAVAAWTGHRIDARAYFGSQALVTAFQLMVHYANDYFDRDGDRALDRTPWSGGSGVLADGVLRPHVALIAALVCAAAGLAASLGFALAGNRVVGGLGIAIGLLAWVYSAPPLRLAARGLGELDTAAIVAVLVPAASYAAVAGTVDGHLVRAVAAPFFGMLAMMLCVELPDAGADRLARKRTLVVRLGFANVWIALVVLTTLAVMLAAAEVIRLGSVLGGVGIAPAVVIGVLLVRRALGDPRPAALAFLGVALYALLVSGLAFDYAVAAVAR
jgi:1,4-dihydroxy-2-naphthoate octaprenyltransferase